MAVGKHAGSSPSFVHRLVIFNPAQKLLQKTFMSVRRALDSENIKAEVWTIEKMERLAGFMDRYITLIILDFEGRPAEECFSALSEVRAAYNGPLLLVNDDERFSPTWWGRKWLVDELATCKTLPDMVVNILKRPVSTGKTALVLAGGGILGGFNEIGSITALHDYGLREFDMYIGLSAGAFVAACAANRIYPMTLIRQQTLGLFDFYSPNMNELVSRVVNFVPDLFRKGYSFAKGSPRDTFFLLSSLFTASLFSGDRMSQKLGVFLEQEGISNDFRVLRERDIELFIVAMDLDDTSRRVFGEHEDCSLPIAEAVAASAALPIAYRPREIAGRYYVDGGIHKTVNIDVAIEHGADLILCVNPLVPYTAGEPGFISDLGVAGIIEQAYRTLLYRRLRVGLEYYRLCHPDVTIVLIEPETTDPETFHNPLNAGPGMIEHAVLSGYQWTRRVIENRFEFIQRAFAARDRSLQREEVNKTYEKLARENFSTEAVRQILFKSGEEK